MKTEKKFEILGDEPVVLEHVSSEVVGSEFSGDRRIKFVVSITFKGKSVQVDFLDSIEHFRAGKVRISKERIVEAFQTALCGASMYSTRDYDTFCKENNLMSKEGCDLYYNRTRDIYKDLHRILGVDGFQMKDMSDHLLKEYDFFPSTTGAVKCVGDVFSRM